MRAADANERVEVQRIERAETKGALEMLDRRVRAAEIGLQPAAAVPRPGRVRVERQCLLKHASGDLVVANDRMRRPQHYQDGRVLAAEGGHRLRQTQRLSARTVQV